MKKQIVFILLALLMLGTILFFYVHNILIPVKVKDFIENQAQTTLQRRITIDDIQFTPFKGFDISNVRIYKKNNDQKILFKADHIRFNVLLAALFKHKAVIVPSLTLENPSLHLVRETKSVWNISDLTNTRISANGKQKYRFFLRTLNIKSGTIDYTDHTKSTDFFDSFEQLNATVTVSIDGGVDYTISCLLPLREASIQSKGTFVPSSKEFSARFSFSNFPASLYLPYYTQLPNIELTNANLTSENLALDYKDNDISLSGALKVSPATFQYDKMRVTGAMHWQKLDARYHKGVLTLSSLLSLPENQITISPNKDLNGNISLNIKELVLTNKHTEVNADITIDGMRLMIDERLGIQGQLSIEDLFIDHDSRFDIALRNASLNQMQLKVADTATLAGDLHLGKTKLLADENETSIDSNIRIDGAKLKFTEERLATGNVNAVHVSVRSKNTKTTVESKLTLSEAFIQTSTGITGRGEPTLDIKISHEASSNQPLTYEGQIELKDASINGIAKLKETTNIKGLVRFNRQRLQSDILTFNTLGTAFLMSGSLRLDDTKKADINLSSDSIDLNLIFQKFSEFFERYNLLPHGYVSLEARYTGSVSSFNFDNLQFKSIFKDGEVELSKLNKRITDINGYLEHSDNTFKWNELSLIYEGIPYHFTGSLDHSAQPLVETSIQSDQLTAEAQFSRMQDTFIIDRFKGKYSFSTFDVNGTADLNKNVDLNFKGVLNFEDIDKLPSNIHRTIQKTNPVGRITLNGSIIGNLNDWRSNTVKLEGHSDSMRLINYPLENISLFYTQKNRAIEELFFNADIYEGRLKLQAKADLLPGSIPFYSFTKLTQMDLTAYRKDKKPKNQYLSGKLAFAFNMEGDLLQPDSYEGIGQMEIKEAYLGQLVPQMSEAIYTAAKGDFFINNRKIYTDNARISSETIDLLAQGWVGFDKQIDFDIVPALKENQLIDTGDVKIDPSALLTKAVSLKITGTLDNPVKKVNTSPRKVFKNTTDVLREGIGSILGEIF